MRRMVLQSPSSRFVSVLLSLNRLMSSQVIGMITRHGHLRKRLHRVGILQEVPLCRMCDEEDKTAEQLLFDYPLIARERYAIFGSLDKDGEFPPRGPDRLFSALTACNPNLTKLTVNRGLEADSVVLKGVFVTKMEKVVV
ncbi:hypothetical protein J6590_095618 [Homalodisca vitripennis]|nr:hypothetical protein J6590_089091 [Homalodisca vitripennis]KAG8275006.1 hypothetical protein J6590_095618 [Homalodisca vitripennis]